MNQSFEIVPYREPPDHRGLMIYTIKLPENEEDELTMLLDKYKNTEFLEMEIGRKQKLPMASEIPDKISILNMWEFLVETLYKLSDTGNADKFCKPLYEGRKRRG